MQQHKILPILFVTVFIDMLGVGILIPVFPLLFAPHSLYRITPATWSTAANYIMAGWLLAIYPLCQFLCAPLLGQLADRYGRRRILALSILGTSLSYMAFAYAIMQRNLWLMFLSRALDGVSGGNIGVAQTVIGDVSEAQHSAKNFGLIGVALGLGFILGPFIGGKLSDGNLSAWFNPTTPFIFAGLLSAINFIVILLLLPETLVKVKLGKLNYLRPLANIASIFRCKYMRHTLPSIFCFNAGFAFYTTFWGMVLAVFLNKNQSQIGDFFAYMGIMIVLAQGAIVRRLSGKVVDYHVLVVAYYGSALVILLFYFIVPDNAYLIYWLPPFLALFIALSKAFSNALLNRLAPAEMRGYTMGVNSSVAALAQAIPAILAGYLAINNVRLPILIGSLVAFAGSVLFSLNWRQLRSYAD